MLDSSVLAALFALSAAVAWGSGDLTSGLGTRRVGPFATVLVSYTAGLLALTLVALASRQMLPPLASLLWGAVAGLAGMVGLGFLLRGFSQGRMGVVAPVSAVMATSIPVIISALTEGMPRTLQLLGFGLALAGLWLLSRPQSHGDRPGGLGVALLAGVGFGTFFVALAQSGDNGAFWPVIVGRLAALLVLVPFALLRRRPVLPPRAPLGLLALAGVLDVSGNLLFLLATQTGRLDVAAVLASLYPAVTALLAWLLAGERMTRPQVIGAAAAIAAIVLITV